MQFRSHRPINRPAAKLPRSPATSRAASVSSNAARCPADILEVSISGACSSPADFTSGSLFGAVLVGFIIGLLSQGKIAFLLPPSFSANHTAQNARHLRPPAVAFPQRLSRRPLHPRNAAVRHGTERNQCP